MVHAGGGGPVCQNLANSTCLPALNSLCKVCPEMPKNTDRQHLAGQDYIFGLCRDIGGPGCFSNRVECGQQYTCDDPPVQNGPYSGLLECRCKGLDTVIVDP